MSLRSGTQGRFNEETGPGKHWWRNFRSHHPELTLHTADNLERSRANALSKDIVNNYFDCLKSTLEENALMNAPRQFFNCDETFLPLNISCEKVIARKNAKRVCAIPRDLRTYHTTLWCISSWDCSTTDDNCFPNHFLEAHIALMGQMMQFTQRATRVGSTVNVSILG